MAPATKVKRTAKRKTAKKSAKKRQIECQECGLVLSVDELCGCEDLSGVACCGSSMISKKK